MICMYVQYINDRKDVVMSNVDAPGNCDVCMADDVTVARGIHILF